jgi:hypothetical protein
VTFSVNREGDAGVLPEEQLGRDLANDLVLFKRYVEEEALTDAEQTRRAKSRREQDQGLALRRPHFSLRKGEEHAEYADEKDVRNAKF